GRRAEDSKEEFQVSMKETMEVAKVHISAHELSVVEDHAYEEENRKKNEERTTMEVVENGPFGVHRVSTSCEKNVSNGEELDNMSMRCDEELEKVFVGTLDSLNVFVQCAGPAKVKNVEIRKKGGSVHHAHMYEKQGEEEEQEGKVATAVEKLIDKDVAEEEDCL
ncbi:hypothetical protein KI387_015844, partial [Taxus chinensis]